MKYQLYRYILLFVVTFSSCSYDEDNESVSETWELTEWTIGMPLDINNDGIASSNLLDEMDCFNGEILQISSKGFLSIEAKNSPLIKIYAVDTSKQAFKTLLECDEGSIGTISEYHKIGNAIMVLGATYIARDNKMSKAVKDEVKVYNSDFTEVLATLDSTKTYEKIDD